VSSYLKRTVGRAGSFPNRIRSTAVHAATASGASSIAAGMESMRIALRGEENPQRSVILN
jgi:hypothetical protein